jgi:hypothetical protein
MFGYLVCKEEYNQIVDLPSLWFTSYFENHSNDVKKNVILSGGGPGVKFHEENFLLKIFYMYCY